MKYKKVALLLSILMIGTTATSNAVYMSNNNLEMSENLEIPEIKQEELKYTRTNEAGNIIEVYEKEIKDDNEGKAKYVLNNKETGRFINVYKGTMDSKEEMKNDGIEVIAPRASSKPTRIEWDNYTSDWSGTTNFTYTKYAFPSGNFVAWADQPFSVIVYDYDYDTSYGRVHADYTNGRYEVESGGGNFSYYCTLSNTGKNAPMTNAIYKSIPYGWHN